jgi:hypothetical protein
MFRKFSIFFLFLSFLFFSFHFFFFSLSSFSSSSHSVLLHAYRKQRAGSSACSPFPMAPPSSPLSPPPSFFVPPPASSPWAPMEAPTPAMSASHGEPNTSSFFFVGWSKRMHMSSLLLSPPSILSKMNCNLRILWDFIFQLNSDSISNSNHKASGLLPHPYPSLGAPTPCTPMPISPQNWTLATTRVPPPSQLPVLAATSTPKPSIQIKPRASHEKPRT